MLGFYEKRKLKQFLYSKAVLAVLVMVVLLLANSVWGVFQKERVARSIAQERQKELAEIEIYKKTLVEDVEWLSTERGVEEEIRRKFEVAKKGERVIVIVDAPEADIKQKAAVQQGFWNWLSEIFSRDFR